MRGFHKQVKIILGKGGSDEERALRILEKQERNERNNNLLCIQGRRLPSKSLAGRLGSKLSKSSSSKLKLILKEGKGGDDLVFGLSSTGRIGQDDLSPEIPSDSLVGRLSAQWHVKHRRVHKEEQQARDKTAESYDHEGTIATASAARATPRASETTTAQITASLPSISGGSCCARREPNKRALMHKRALSARHGLLTDETRDRLLSKEPSTNGVLEVPLAIDSERLLSSQQPLSSKSLAGRLRRRKETARLRLEQQASRNLSQVTILKRRVDENGNPILSKSLAGCLTTGRRDVKSSKHGKGFSFRRRKSADMLSIDSSTTVLNNSLCGRLKMLTACTKAQMERQGRRDILNATASTCSESFCIENFLEGQGLEGAESSGRRRVKDPQALELAIEMREAMDKRGMQERRVGLQIHPETFLHSEALMWLADRQVQFEEEKCRQEQESASSVTKAPSPEATNDVDGIACASAPPFPRYSRYEDNLLDWKACHTGDMIKNAGYIVQLNGKDGFRAHRKLNCVFKFNDALIARDVQRLRRAEQEAKSNAEDAANVPSHSPSAVLLFEHSKILEDSNGEIAENESVDNRPLRTIGFFDSNNVAVVVKQREVKKSENDLFSKSPKKPTSTSRIVMVDEQERAILKAKSSSLSLQERPKSAGRVRNTSSFINTSVPPKRSSCGAFSSRSMSASVVRGGSTTKTDLDVITKLRQKEELNEQKRLQLQREHSVARLKCLGGM